MRENTVVLKGLTRRRLGGVIIARARIIAYISTNCSYTSVRPTAGIAASVYDARPALSSPLFSLHVQEPSHDTAGVHINVN